ncbi:vesicular membrane trafficking protein p18 [Oopsacas minuta]|uniref:Vesicular membrane trafficking protein p18 n=1 Tax=Oopsacas minuta TaxID=111878 RepID=A0AAV7KKJ4_9METZ|nr:vesicular membrane trafficking protein p18 [Oopsacas minuta]
MAVSYRTATSLRETQLRQNDELTDDIRRSVAYLKDISVDMRDDIRESNELLHEIHTKADPVQDYLTANMQLLRRISHSSNKGHFMCYLLLFIIVISFILYIVSWFK